MSGPIIRKYGFPNFDEIFGKKELQHGVDPTPPVESKQTDEKAEAAVADQPKQPGKTDESGH